tara:strand:+ start:593 stop:751 length:159 start_codon:yes stop_codon:yes gene_type:complete
MADKLFVPWIPMNLPPNEHCKKIIKGMKNNNKYKLKIIKKTLLIILLYNKKK